MPTDSAAVHQLAMEESDDIIASNLRQLRNTYRFQDRKMGDMYTGPGLDVREQTHPR
jgi:hypothetical protein